MFKTKNIKVNLKGEMSFKCGNKLHSFGSQFIYKNKICTEGKYGSAKNKNKYFYSTLEFAKHFSLYHLI